MVSLCVLFVKEKNHVGMEEAREAWRNREQILSCDPPLLKDSQRPKYKVMSELQIYRRTYIPPLPTILTKDVEVKKCEALGAAGDHGSLVG